MLKAGYDIGGTKSEIALLRLEKDAFEVVFRKRMPTEREQGYHHILEVMTELFEDAKKAAGSGQKIDGVGIGLPGSIDPKTFKMFNGNTNAFVGHDLHSDFSKIFKSVPFVCANDANCFALAEARLGRGLDFEKEFGISREQQLAVGVIIGTGCGAGLIVNGKMVIGKHGGAGELGHTLMDPNGPKCYCGLNGCFELYISGTGLEQSYADLQRGSSGSSSELTVKGPEIFNRAKTGDVGALKCIEIYKKNLAVFLANATRAFDPHYFVLGGGVSLQSAIYDGLEDLVRARMFLPVDPPKVYQNKLGDSAGVIGAALLELKA